MPLEYLRLFICLFIWSLSSHSRIFHSYVDVTIAGEGLQILTYARHSWPLSSEGSLRCHTCCDTGLSFIMVISEDLWHSQLLPSDWHICSHIIVQHYKIYIGSTQGNSARVNGMSNLSIQADIWYMDENYYPSLTDFFTFVAHPGLHNFKSEGNPLVNIEGLWSFCYQILIFCGIMFLCSNEVTW